MFFHVTGSEEKRMEIVSTSQDVLIWHIWKKTPSCFDDQSIFISPVKGKFDL